MVTDTNADGDSNGLELDRFFFVATDGNQGTKKNEQLFGIVSGTGGFKFVDVLPFS